MNFTAVAAFDDGELLARLGGDRALVHELIGLFIEDCPRQLDAIRIGLANIDAGAVLRAAHALQGSAGNFSAREVVALAQRLEARAHEGDLTTSTEVFHKLEAEVPRLLAGLASVRR